MTRKAHMDAIGAAALIAFALHLAFNQVVIKITNGGFGPVFMAGLRSAGALVILLMWMRYRRLDLHLPRASWFGGVMSGLFFAFEFLFLFNALDLTTVGRASILFYSMPVWLSLAAHFCIPGERLSPLRILGLVLAVGGVALAVLDREAGSGALTGDLLALLGAMCWAGIALCVRVTPLSEVPAEQQLLWQLMISAPILLLLAPFLGDLLREVTALHLAGLAFQIVAVASFGFLFWFWLMKIYPAGAVASFSFLSPVFAVLLGWALLDEVVEWTVWAALALVAVGIFLINRR